MEGKAETDNRQSTDRRYLGGTVRHFFQLAISSKVMSPETRVMSPKISSRAYVVSPSSEGETKQAGLVCNICPSLSFDETN